MAVGQTTGTSSNALAEALAAYYDRLLISWEKPWLKMMQLAQKRPMPKHSGTTAYFTGYRPLAKPTSALTEGSSPTAVGYAARQISATLAEWGNTAKMSTLLSMTKIDPALEEQVALIADNAGRTLDYQLSKTVAKTGVWGISAANRTTNVQTITCSSSANNSTTVFQSTAATSLNALSDDATWTGAIVTVVSDGLTANGSTVKYGYAGRVSSVSFNASTGDAWTLSTAAPCAAAPEAFQSSDRVRIVALSNITTSTNISSTFFALAQRDLKGNYARPMGGNYYASVLPTDVTYSMVTDTTWVNASQYSDISNLYEGEIGRWYGCRVMETTEPYREDTDGTENESSGIVHHAFFTGRDAFGHTDLASGGRKIHVVNGPDTNEPIPRNVYVSWQHTYAQKALTAPWCVDVVCGAAV